MRGAEVLRRRAEGFPRNTLRLGCGGDCAASSGIDVLVVTRRVELKYGIMVAVCGEVEAPVGLHAVTPEPFGRWYRRSIKPEEIEEV